MTLPPDVPSLPPRGCPVCLGQEPQLLHEQRFLPMSDGSLLTGYDVVACGSCGFCYADRIPTQDAFDQYYRDMSKYESVPASGNAFSFDVQRFRRTADRIRSQVPDTESRILEVGCANGLLLATLKKDGYRFVAGLDPSSECARTADRLYQIPVHCGTLSDHDIPSESVNLAITIGVLEHVRDLDTALASIVTLLTEGGRIFLTVPDASRYVTGEDAPYQEFSLEHINFFGPCSLTRLMMRYGLKRVFLEQERLTMNSRTITPVIHAAFEKTASSFNEDNTKDEETPRELRRYIELSAKAQDAMDPILEALAVSRRPLMIWGVGTHTLRLLASSALAKANLVGLVDSNPRYRGKRVMGFPILSPDDLFTSDAAILISTRGYQEALSEYIRQQLGLANEVITLYDFR